MPVISTSHHMRPSLPPFLSTTPPSSMGPRDVITDKEATVGTEKDTDTPTEEASTIGVNNKGIAILKHGAIVPPSSSFPELMPPCPPSSNSHCTLPLCRLCCLLPTPCLWLVVVCWADRVGHHLRRHCYLIVLSPSSPSPPLFVDCCFHHLPRPHHH